MLEKRSLGHGEVMWLVDDRLLARVYRHPWQAHRWVAEHYPKPGRPIWVEAYRSKDEAMSAVRQQVGFEIDWELSE